MSSTKRKGAGHIEDNCKAVAIRRCRDLGAELLMDDHSFDWRIKAWKGEHNRAVQPNRSQ